MLKKGRTVFWQDFTSDFNTTPTIYFLLPGHKYHTVKNYLFVMALGGQGVFREFLKSEFSEENIEFWLACEDYKKTKSDNLQGKAERIYEEFVQSDAVKQVCIMPTCAESEGRSVAPLRCSHTHSVA